MDWPLSFLMCAAGMVGLISTGIFTTMLAEAAASFIAMGFVILAMLSELTRY